jgi:multidrug resistance efflux pump
MNHHEQEGVKKRQRPMSVGLPVLLLAGACLVGTAGALHFQEATATPPTGREEVQPAGRPLPTVVCLGVVDFEGGVRPLAANVPGRVVELPVHENDVVRQGTLLLRLDDTVARARVGECESAVEGASAQLALARAAPRQHELLVTEQESAVAAAEHELAAGRLLASRQEDLVKLKLANRLEADASLEQVKRLEASRDAARAKLGALALHDPAQDVRRAEAELRAKQCVVDQARHALAEHSLRAPVDGVIVRVQTSTGATIGPQAPQPAFLLAPDQPRVVRAEVDQEVASRVAVGQKAMIDDDAVTAGPIWEGQVIRVAEWFAPRRTIIADSPAFQDVRLLECLVRVDQGESPLRLGQRVRVRLYPKETR